MSSAAARTGIRVASRSTSPTGRGRTGSSTTPRAAWQRGCSGRGLAKGDRVVALGTNSDAYALLWLGCDRAGLVGVPVNHNLVGGELS
jgi:fatty-acyl-CoA synthase